MKRIIRKAYWDYENEEKWINDMAQKGLLLDNYSWCKYTFQEGENGEYIYRIELMDNRVDHPESQAYLKFLSESGVEHVASYMRWVYLRKRAVDGKFDIYTDINSKIKHYISINRMWMALGAAELAIGVGNLVIATSIFSSVEVSNIVNINFIGGLICTVIGIFLLIMSRPLRKKIRKLKQDAQVHQ